MDATQPTIDLDTKFSINNNSKFIAAKNIIIPVNFKLKSSNGFVIFKELIGKGGFGKIYKIQISTKELAMKVIDSERQLEILTLMSFCSPHEVSLFFSNKSLNDPPIVKFMGSGSFTFDNNFFSYYIMPIYTETFGQFNKRKLGNSECLIDSTFIVMERVYYALEYLNDKNIIHNDIKEDNILFKMYNTPSSSVIADFGSANYKPNLNEMEVKGTISFMSLDSHELKSTYRGDFLSSIFVMYNIFSKLPWYGSHDLNEVRDKKKLFLDVSVLLINQLVDWNVSNFINFLVENYFNLDILDKPNYQKIIERLKNISVNKDICLSTIMKTLDISDNDVKIKKKIEYEEVGNNFMKLLSYTSRNDIGTFLTLLHVNQPNGFSYTYTLKNNDVKCACKKLPEFYKEYECVFYAMVSFSRYTLKNEHFKVN
uniref:non-specific serine/threonine protein kinase n=1 Tax=Strongyloides papillosus TaxID=174720 RepID=A0A0N5BQ43_STREA